MNTKVRPQSDRGPHKIPPSVTVNGDSMWIYNVPYGETENVCAVKIFFSISILHGLYVVILGFYKYIYGAVYVCSRDSLKPLESIMCIRNTVPLLWCSSTLFEGVLCEHQSKQKRQCKLLPWVVVVAQIWQIGTLCDTQLWWNIQPPFYGNCRIFKFSITTEQTNQLVMKEVKAALNIKASCFQTCLWHSGILHHFRSATEFLLFFICVWKDLQHT